MTNPNDMAYWGLTKREEIATRMMIGRRNDSSCCAHIDADYLAEFVVEDADALIAKLNKENPDAAEPEPSQ